MVPIIFLGKWGHFQKSVQKIWDLGEGEGEGEEGIF